MKKKQMKTKRKTVKKKPVARRVVAKKKAIKRKSIAKRKLVAKRKPIPRRKRLVKRKLAKKKQGPVTYDILFHDDFDGRASAAILLDFLKSRNDRVDRFVAVNHDNKATWIKSDGLTRIAQNTKKGRKNPVIVVDFGYHPAATWWFDHHPTTFLKESWEDRFRPSATHHFAPEYASACRLVMDALVEYHGYRPPKHIREMAAWLDICDGAQYRSARQTILLKEPALQINAYIDDSRQKGDPLLWLIKMMSEKGLPAAARDRRIRSRMKEIHAEQKKAVEYYKENLLVRKQVGYIDISDLKHINMSRLRFVSYYLRPNILYAVTRKQRTPNDIKFTVGANPWKRDRNPLHIGGLLMKHGGGGHKNVGAVHVTSIVAADKFTEYLVTLLNNAVA